MHFNWFCCNVRFLPGRNAKSFCHIAFENLSTLQRDVVEIFKDLGGLLNTSLFAINVNRIMTSRNANPEGVSNATEVFISRTEEGQKALRVNDGNRRAGHLGPEAT